MSVGTFSTFLGGTGRFKKSGGGSWATIRDATAAGESFASYEIDSEESPASTWTVQRCMLPVDTSSIASDATIDAVEVRGNFNYEGGASSSTIVFIKTTQGSVGARDLNDYNNVQFTSGGSLDITSSSAAAGTIVGNATALTWIVKAGTTLIGIIGEQDLNNTDPTAIDTWVTMTSPALVVTYTAAGGGGGIASYKNLTGVGQA